MAASIPPEIERLMHLLPADDLRLIATTAAHIAAEADRAEEAEKHAGPKPTIWQLNGQAVDYWQSDLDEALNEIEASFGDVIETAGYAVVQQQFLAIRHDDDGPRYESFATRAGAEAYVTEMRADGATFQAQQKRGPKLPDDMDMAEREAFAIWWKQVIALGAWLDEADEKNLDSATWLTRFRAKMTPDAAFRDADLIPF